MSLAVAAVSQVVYISARRSSGQAADAYGCEAPSPWLARRFCNVCGVGTGVDDGSCDGAATARLDLNEDVATTAAFTASPGQAATNLR